ncbi:MAG: c-type cytochrome [Ignavibacteriaceae bacterium]
MLNKKSSYKILSILAGLMIILFSSGWVITGGNLENKINSGSKEEFKVDKNLPANLNLIIKKDSLSEGDKPAEKVYKNIKVFKGMPASRLIPTMRFISAALGAECKDCHVSDNKGWHFDKDTKPGKRKARKMIEMMNEINKNNFKGHTEVNCETCHRGNFEVQTVPALLQLPLKRNKEEGDIKVVNRLNTPKEIIDKYVNAIGGKKAYEKIKSIQIRGSFITEGGEILPLKITQSAPDFYLYSIVTPRGLFSKGYDGKTGWTQSGNRTNKMEEDDLAQVKELADFYRTVNLDSRYTKLEFKDVKVIEGDTVYEVEGTASQYLYDKFFFDVKTGLLIRQIEYDETALGSLATQMDFKDYKNVGGVLMPFTIKRSGYNFNQTLSFSKITPNVSVDNKIFEFPGK